MEQKEINEFRNRYFTEFGLPIDPNDEVFPLIYSVVKSGWNLDQKVEALNQKAQYLAELEVKLNKVIQTIDESADIIQSRSNEAKTKLIIENQETAIAWWYGKRHFFVLICAVVFIFTGLVYFGISRYTKVGKLDEFYSNGKTEVIDGTTYILLDPSKKDFVIGKNYIILDNNSIAIPVHSN